MLQVLSMILENNNKLGRVLASPRKANDKRVIHIYSIFNRMLLRLVYILF